MKLHVTYGGDNHRKTILDAFQITNINASSFIKLVTRTSWYL